MVSNEKKNDCATKGCIVILGSDYMSELPAHELAALLGMKENIYNQSEKNATIEQVLSNLEKNVISLDPSKVFVNLGEVDLKRPAFDADEFIAQYEWLLYQIHSKTSALLYVVSVLSPSPEVKKLNNLLQEKAEELGCIYISLDQAMNS